MTMFKSVYERVVSLSISSACFQPQVSQKESVKILICIKQCDKLVALAVTRESSLSFIQSLCIDIYTRQQLLRQRSLTRIRANRSHPTNQQKTSDSKNLQKYINQNYKSSLIYVRFFNVIFFNLMFEFIAKIELLILDGFCLRFRLCAFNLILSV